MNDPGVLMVDLRGLAPEADEVELLRRECVGGVILFRRNFASPGQLRELAGAIRECAPEVLIAVDQEGGRVQRFREGFTALPPLRRIGEAYEADPERGLRLARDCAWVMASEIIGAGLDFSFAPVLDLHDPASPVIGDRAFAADPDAVAELARVYLGGMAEAGMAGVGKHFPGHGLVGADSHVELPVDNRGESELRDWDMRPFVRCRDLLAGVMPAHVVYPAVCADAAGFSRYWLQTVLRDEIGFDGVIFSDDLSMSAAEQAGAMEQRLEKALAAGCDMLLACNAPDEALRAADWLESENVPPNGRLAAMRARPGAQPDDERWRQALERVRELEPGG